MAETKQYTNQELVDIRAVKIIDPVKAQRWLDGEFEIGVVTSHVRSLKGKQWTRRGTKTQTAEQIRDPFSHVD